MCDDQDKAGCGAGTRLTTMIRSVELTLPRLILGQMGEPKGANRKRKKIKVIVFDYLTRQPQIISVSFFRPFSPLVSNLHGSDNGLRPGWVGSDLQEGVTAAFCLRGRRISRAPYNITLSMNDTKIKECKYSTE